MKHLQPEILQAGDVVVTTDMKPFSLVTRSRTWPKRSWFDMGLSTHSFMVADRGDRIYYACEMQPRGLEMNELEKYDHGRLSWLPHIVKVYRHKAFETPGMVDKANDYMVKMHSFKVRYGYDELLKYAGLGKKDDPYSMICSQWCRNVFAHCGIEMPFGTGICTPADWQRWGMCGDVMTEINPFK